MWLAGMIALLMLAAGVVREFPALAIVLMACGLWAGSRSTIGAERTLFAWLFLLAVVGAVGGMLFGGLPHLDR